MMRAPLLIPIVLLVALTACGGPRKACRSAERKVRRALVLCPEMARMDTVRDTVVVRIPADSAAGWAAAIEPHADSLAAVVAQLSEALSAERELYAVGVGAAGPTPAVQQAVGRARRTLCQFDPIHVFDGPLELHIVAKAEGGIIWGYHLKPQEVVRTVQVPVRQVVPCPDTRTMVAGWYRSGFWLLVAVLIIFLLATALLIRHNFTTNTNGRLG